MQHPTGRNRPASRNRSYPSCGVKSQAKEVDQFLAAWVDDASYFKRQPGYISTQLHRGIAGSCVFLNVAVWESVDHFRCAFANPEFRAKLGQYPTSAVASPHLFRKVAVPDVCVA